MPTTGATGLLAPQPPLALAVVGGNAGRASKLVIGTRAGLYTVEGQGEPQQVSEDPVAVLALDPAGALWGATEDGKLGRLTAEGWQIVAQVGDKIGAPVKDLAVAADGTAWFATRWGCCMRTPEGSSTILGSTTSSRMRTSARWRWCPMGRYGWAPPEA